jgi:hypothetical protein
MQDQDWQVAAVEAATVEGSAATGGSKITLARASRRERLQQMQGEISGGGSRNGRMWLILILLCGNK